MRVFTKAVAVVHLDANTEDLEKASAVLAATEYPTFTTSSFQALENLEAIAAVALPPADVILFGIDNIPPLPLYEGFRRVRRLYAGVPIVAVTRATYDVDRVYSLISVGMDNVYVVGYSDRVDYSQIVTFIVRALARHSHLNLAAEQISQTWKLLEEIKAELPASQCR